MTPSWTGTKGTSRLAAAGEWLRRHAGAIRILQWIMVGFYLILLIVPAALPLPPAQARILDHVTVAAQFLFWGLWWPFVLVSVVLFGRVWCCFARKERCPNGPAAMAGTVRSHAGCAGRAGRSSPLQASPSMDR
jgi:hypothetical protein